MWCDNHQCKKEVDINSVAVNNPSGAYSMDVEGDVTPTIIRSTSNIINICKSCGESDFLYPSKAAAEAARQLEEAQFEARFEAAQKETAQRRKLARNPFVILVTVATGIIGGIWTDNSEASGFSGPGYGDFFFGCLIFGSVGLFLARRIVKLKEFFTK